MEEEFGKSFIKNYNKRIRQHLSQSDIPSKPSTQRGRAPTPTPTPTPPSSTGPSTKTGTPRESQDQRYDYIYSKNNRANILNVVSQISDDVTPNFDIALTSERLLLDVDDEAGKEGVVAAAEYLGRGATMEVFAINYRLPETAAHSECNNNNNNVNACEEKNKTESCSKVAVKRVSREYAPVRNHALALEEDFVFLKGRDAFYAKVDAMMQEIKIMAREPIYRQRNIVHLNALAWDEMPGDVALFAPIMIVELAWTKAPTLEDYFNLRKTRKLPTPRRVDESIELVSQDGKEEEEATTDDYSLIADIADGLSVLHNCEVLHSDLKPSNILLFPDPHHYQRNENKNIKKSQIGLIAKIGDFGFADVERVLNPTDSTLMGRGQTREWAAPEMVRGCPLAIRRLASTVPVAGDIYSFGLLMAYILLGGRSPREIASPSRSDKGSIDDIQLDRLKLDGLLEKEIEEVIEIQWKHNPPQTEEDQHKSRIVRDLIADVVKVDPTARLSSLSNVRLQLLGHDPYAIQKHRDKFRYVPFTQIFGGEMAKGNLFQTITGVSKRILDSLPTNLIKELHALVGEKPSMYEPTMHSLRRIELQQRLGNDNATKDMGEKPLLDEDIGKWSVDTLRSTISWGKDIIGMARFIFGYFFNVPHAEYDFLRTEYQYRPRIFTCIDGNDIRAVRDLLTKDPAQVKLTLGEDSGGWFPIHLAACLGRIKILKIILSIDSVDPNQRSTIAQSTPLHQAIVGKHPKAVKLLLQAGAQVDARYYIPDVPHGRLRDLTPLELAVEQCVTDGKVTQDDKKIVEMLLRAGADYLHNSGGRGYSVVFKALTNIELTKLFFETIPPQDAKLLAGIVDSNRQTLLFHAANMGDVPLVKYLLARGVDTRARDLSGQNVYTKQRTAVSVGSSGPGLLMMLIKGATKQQPVTLEVTEQIMRLIEEAGGPEAMAPDDYSHSAQEVEDLQQSFKTYEPATQQYLQSDIFLKRLGLLWGMMDDSSLSTAFWLFQADNVMAMVTLKNNLERWHAKRKQGLIARDELPQGWAEFFQEPEKSSSGGFWKIFIVEEDIPPIAEFLKNSTISLAESFMDNIGSLILQKSILVILEMTAVRTSDRMAECLSVIFPRLAAIFMKNFNISWMDRAVIYRHLNRTWKAFSQGEVLDRLHDLAAALGIDNNLDEFARGMLLEDMDVDLPIPPDAIETLRLPQRYPKATIFITSKTIDIHPKRVIISLIQLIALLIPPFVFMCSVYLESLCLRADSIWGFVLAEIWYNLLLPRDWIMVDSAGHWHPNIMRGLFAALELIWFRIRCPWIDLRSGEPLILALQPGAKQIDIPTRLHHLKKETIFPIYWLTLRTNAEYGEPVPCFAAMGDVYRKWKNGKLPRKAWCDGWWEKTEQGDWKRVNANGRPTWSEYTQATQEIKTRLTAKGCDEVYRHFLAVRDYWLLPPAEQLRSLKEVFGRQHHECLEIWQQLFMKDSSGRPWIGRSDQPTPWWNRFSIKLFLDGVWSSRQNNLLDLLGY